MKFIDPGFKGTNPGYYSAAVVSHGMLYVSGQLSINPDTREPCTGGIREHAALALDNLDRILKAAGARRALRLPVGGAFHSPLMQPAKDELQAAIEATTFNTPKCAVYQNVDAQAHTDAEEIKANLIAQLTASVRWTQEVQNMIAAGATDFTECGPGKVLQGMIGKIAKGNDAVTAHGIQA